MGTASSDLYLGPGDANLGSQACKASTEPSPQPFCKTKTTTNILLTSFFNDRVRREKTRRLEAKEGNKVCDQEVLHSYVLWQASLLKVQNSIDYF